MREEAVVLGEDRRIAGILTPPGGAPSGQGVLILNAGIIHRVGPNRLHVRLARALAAHGHTVLRIDQSGIGDTAPDRRSDSVMASVLSDATSGLDFLAARNCRRLVIFGLCSGAYHGVYVARADVRVDGLVLVDLAVPPTRGYWVRRIGSRLLSARTWRLVLTGQHRLPAEIAAQRRARREEPTVGGDQETPASMALGFRQLVDRGTEFFCVFTGGNIWYNYRRQFTDAYRIGFGRQLRLEYLPGASHIFDSERSKAELVDGVVEWMSGLERASPRPRPADVPESVPERP